jgi:ketosteroid isomerase-like protein
MKVQPTTSAPLQPATCSRAFAWALSSGDLDAAAACFARDGCLVTPDATAIHGRERIRPLLAQMVIRRTEIAVELSSAIGTGDVVLLRERWRVRSGAPEARVEQTLHPTLVLQRIEAAWKLSIVSPWGSGPVAP